MTVNKDSKAFCMAPWTHLHVWPNGNAYPCCMTHMDQPIGNARESKLYDIWNNETMRKLRLDMLQGKFNSLCNRCFELDNSGSNSLRKHMNRTFTTHDDVVESTKEDGTVEKFNMAYMDIRFSNICNLKCRSCGPHLSSGWYEDHKKLYPNGNNDFPKIDHATDDPETLWQQLVPLLDTTEEIYFAGGEPLIMEEHYRILKWLIENNRTDVRIRYNTNFSKLKFKKDDVIELWKKFNSVSIGASLDAMGQRGEYMRKGQNWAEVVSNRERLIQEAPHVEFFVSSTYSLMNSLHLPDFHREWLEKKYIDKHSFNINILTEPRAYNLQILPHEVKVLVEQKIENHINWLQETYGNMEYGHENYQHDNAESVINHWKSAVKFMYTNDRSDEISHFFDRNNKVDGIRNEKFFDTFPELDVLRRKYSNHRV